MIVNLSSSCDTPQNERSLEERALSYFIEVIFNSEPSVSTDELISRDHLYDYGDGLRVIPDLPEYFTKTKILNGFSLYSSGNIYESTTLPIHPDSADLFLENDDTSFGQVILEDEENIEKQIELKYPIIFIDSYKTFNTLNVTRSFYIYVHKSIKQANQYYVQISCIGPKEGVIYERYNFYIVFDSEKNVKKWFITVSE